MICDEGKSATIKMNDELHQGQVLGFNMWLLFRAMGSNAKPVANESLICDSQDSILELLDEGGV